MKVGIIGLRYVGLPLAVSFAETGHEVVGLDTDGRVVDRIRDGESTVEDVPSERLTAAGERLRSTTEHSELAACEAVVICVPTPLANHREPGLAELAYHHPHVPELPELGLSSAELGPELARTDLACVITPHPEVDYRRLVSQSALVLDFRGVTRGIEAPNLVRL